VREPFDGQHTQVVPDRARHQHDAIDVARGAEVEDEISVDAVLGWTTKQAAGKDG
jgi:hypothetical protein